MILLQNFWDEKAQSLGRKPETERGGVRHCFLFNLPIMQVDFRLLNSSLAREIRQEVKVADKGTTARDNYLRSTRQRALIQSELDNVHTNPLKSLP